VALHTPLEKALLRNALKRHAHDSGKYVLINTGDGNSFVGQSSADVISRDSYWYGTFPAWHTALSLLPGRSIVIVFIQPQFDINAGELGDGRFNITSCSRDIRARLLSNFANYPFVIEKQHCASVEGFIQAIKYPHGSVKRWRTFLQSGKTAKAASVSAPLPSVWWRGVQIPYGSSQHHALIDTGDLVLLHDTGAKESPNTSLPASTFCDILTRLRTKLQQQSKPLT